MPTFGRSRRMVAVALLALHLAGCYSWKASPLSPRELLTTRSPSRIRVATASGTRLVVRQPVLDADSIRGRIFEERARAYRLAEMPGIALADVTRVELRRINVVGTAIAATLTLVVVGTAVFAIACSASDCIGW